MLTVPENVWNIDELVLEETKEVDFNRSDADGWWHALPLKMLDLSSNAINEIAPQVKQLVDLVTLKVRQSAIKFSQSDVIVIHTDVKLFQVFLLELCSRL